MIIVFKIDMIYVEDRKLFKQFFYWEKRITICIPIPFSIFAYVIVVYPLQNFSFLRS